MRRKKKLKEVLKRNGNERQKDREGLCTGERQKKREKDRQRQCNGKWESESKPVGEEAPAEFQVVLMALRSHLDLYCS